MTRFEDTEPEEKMAKLDVFFIEEGGSVFYHETIDRASNPVYKQGEFTLNKKRSDFAVNVKYYVYIVANATADLAKVGTKADLMALVQEDENLYLSGFGVEGAPNIFLMDGYADVKENDSKVPVAVTVNDGTNGKTSLTGILRRAAAKVIINITQGDNVQFKQRIPDEGNLQGEALYSIYQLPVSTLVLTPDGSSWHNSKKVTTPDQRINNTTFTWTEGNDGKPQIRIIAYAYANDWSDTEITKETSMILNLPMLWDHDNDKTNDPESRPNSWFKIPLSRENKFERNTCYQINIKINAVGAQDKSSVIELQDIEYVTREWITQRVEVGQNESKPQYLMLNTDLVEIYNENFDATSLTFSSSSYIKSITLKDVYKQNSDGSFTKETDSHKAYYINKFGQITDLSSDIISTISAIAETGKLNGGITITSPIVPATQAEINLQIAALNKPLPPTVTPPVPPEEPEGKPVEPESVEEPTQPEPQDYVPNNTWKYEYRYNTQSKKFQMKSRRSNNWQDIDDPKSYTEALENYEAYLAAYNQYLTDYEAYQNALDQWMSTDEYKNYEPVLEAYNAELQTYEAVMNAYQTELDAYNAAVDAIKASAEGEETHYDTIRYLEFEVTNETGQTATFRVMQYPVIYVVNQQGYYSYRDDFIANDGTVVHYQNRKANYFTTAYWHGYKLQIKNGDNWADVDGTTRYETIYSYSGNYYALSGNNVVRITNRYAPEFTEDGKVYRKYYNSLNNAPGTVFTSDVVREVYTSGNNIGKADLDQYANSNNAWRYSDSKDPGNQRMYHVRVTSTSSQYTVGRPRIIDDNGNPTSDVESGHTDDSEDNSLLVSPSFMIASQLGVTSSVDSPSESNYERAVTHCKNYVETYFVDKDNDNQWDQGEEVVHYHDWRLPTAAEIAIIADLQGKANGAVDVVLAGQFYFCASLSKAVTGLKEYSSSGYFIRCIRDAY